MYSAMKITCLSKLSNRRLHRVITRSIIIIATIVDLGTKHVFYTNQHGGTFNRIQPAFNHGISYSIGLNMALIILVSVICLLRVTRMYINRHIHSITMILIMSGGVGNLVDRIVYGGVRDFIYIGNIIPIFNFIFNIADIYLILGGILLIYHYNQVDITSQDPDSKKHLV